MVGKLFLGGGGSEEVSLEVDKVFFNDVKKVLYVPWAWHDDNFSGCLEWFKGLTRRQGNIEIDMLEDWKRQVELENYNAVYIGGGNTFKLLDRLKSGGLGESLIKYYNLGGKIFGGSAGAMVFGKDMDLALICSHKDVNKIGLENTSGFDLVYGHDIQTHWEKQQEKEHMKYVSKTTRDIIGIPEESALVVSGNSGLVIGTKPIYLISTDNVKKYDIDEIVKL